MANDPAVQSALDRRSALHAEIDRINTFLALYEQFQRPVEKSEGEVTVQNIAVAAPAALIAPPEKPSASSPDEIVVQKAPRGMPQTYFEEFVRQLLVERGHPAQINDILALIHARGRHVGGHSEVLNLKTKLWRAKEKIVSIPGAGYWPIDLPCPAVDYDPPRPKPLLFRSAT